MNEIAGEKSALEASANELRQQNSTIRNDYAGLKDKLFAVEKAYTMENESLKQSEKCTKERAEKLSADLDRAKAERDKLRAEIGLVLSKCQEGLGDPRAVRATPTGTSRSRLGLNMRKAMESQTMNLTPLPDEEDNGESKREESDRYASNTEIQDKYRAEQFKNKMLLVEIRTGRLKQQKMGGKAGY